MQPIVLGMVLLWAAMDSSLSQGPLLWCHNDMTVIVSRNTSGPEWDTQQRLDNTNARRWPSIDRFFVFEGFNAICFPFLKNNPIYIEGRNCSLVQSPCYSLNALAFYPRTPYRVGGLADDVMPAWVSHSVVNHWIYNFKASLGTSAWPYRVTTQYSHYIYIYFPKRGRNFFSHWCINCSYHLKSVMLDHIGHRFSYGALVLGHLWWN